MQRDNGGFAYGMKMVSTATAWIPLFARASKGSRQVLTRDDVNVAICGIPMRSADSGRVIIGGALEKRRRGAISKALFRHAAQSFGACIMSRRLQDAGPTGHRVKHHDGVMPDAAKAITLALVPRASGTGNDSRITAVLCASLLMLSLRKANRTRKRQ